MSSATVGTPLGSNSYTAAQTRIIDAALALFAEHGISGTSLQMIADAIGVTSWVATSSTSPSRARASRC